MRRVALLASIAVAVAVAGTVAEAQEVRVNGPLRLSVRARNFLEAGNTIRPYSQVNPASVMGQQVSYLISPPYAFRRDAVGEGTLPDAFGPFAGARSAFGPVDYNGALMGLPPIN